MASLPPEQGEQFVVILTYCFLGAVLAPIVISSFRRKFLKGMDPSQVQVMHFRLMWHRVPPVMQEVVAAARKRNHIADVNGHLVQTVTDENGRTTTVERSERFEESGF